MEVDVYTINLAMECSLKANQEIVPNGIVVTKWFKSDYDVEGLYGVDRKTKANIISFGGTDSIKEFFLNIKFGKKEIPYEGTSKKIKVHGGFLKGYKGVRENIHEYIDHNKLNRTKWIICGFSLGAAIATLCALDIRYNFPDLDITCITFGSPRVGNRAFVKSYKKRNIDTIRVANGCDIVTRLPYWVMGFGHVCGRYQIGRRTWRKFIMGSLIDHLSYRFI